MTTMEEQVLDKAAEMESWRDDLLRFVVSDAQRTISRLEAQLCAAYVKQSAAKRVLEARHPVSSPLATPPLSDEGGAS